MNTKEIEHNIQTIIDNFIKEEFIYDFLLAYGISKTSVTRLKKGDFNLAKNENEILYKKKIFFTVADTDKLLTTIDDISKDERIIKHKPRFAIVTDYTQLLAKDLRLGTTLDIKLQELPKHFSFFLPLSGSEVYSASNDNEADRNASYKMANLYDLLREENPEIYDSKESIHHLNIFLSRLLFCYFAEDTEIFEEDSIFTNTLVQHTNENGSDTHTFLTDLFRKLNTNGKDGFAEYLAKFPYVNGGLFKDDINVPVFSVKARKVLIELGDLDWKDINPDIFGSMIQAVVMDEYRSDLGMHYTSVPNILKLIKPLFLDELYEEFEKSKGSVKKLQNLIRRISKIKFFDPACGSGNFLIITYKEIRVLEIKILQQIIELEQSHLLIDSVISLEQFYGIEIDDFAHEVAILSLWLAEHQMNQYFEEQLAGYTEHKSIIPLKKSGTIVQGNATRVNWKEVCPITLVDEVYVIGNPPYLGARLQDAEQKRDMSIVLYDIKGHNNMDYIVCWFYKAADYIKGLNAKVALVSTNSICQGEQVALIWSHIFSKHIEIDFAHQSFKWTNNAKGNAGVTVIIVGLRNISKVAKYLFKDNLRKLAKNINPYLLDAPDVIVTGRSKALSKFPEMSFGSMPNDQGFLLLSEEEKEDLVTQNSNVTKYIKQFSGGAEFVKGIKKYCLWINDKTLQDALRISKIMERINNVEIHRLSSKREATQKLADTPHQFGEIRHKNTDSIIIPATSSEKRDYIPIGFLNGDTVISNSAMAIYDAEAWLFAVVTSRMHMVWVRAVGGKLETRYRYSAKLCYNTFPFPNISTKQKENLNLYVFAILDERAKHPSKTLAQLYNLDTMPKGLLKAHQELDTAIEQCYRLQPFKNDTERLEYLFKLYEEMVKKDTLFAKQKKPRKKKEK